MLVFCNVKIPSHLNIKNLVPDRRRRFLPENGCSNSQEVPQISAEGYRRRRTCAAVGHTLHTCMICILVKYLNKSERIILKRKHKEQSKKKMRREAYHRLKNQPARSLVLLVIILGTSMVVVEGVSAANLPIVSNASSLAADYMEVNGGEESPMDWETAGRPHIGYMAIRNHGPAVCKAIKYQSCLPNPNGGPRRCKDFRDRTC